jgi:hypothetical protein
MKTFVLAGLVLAIGITPVFAQPALPVCKRPVTLPEAIQAMRTDDRRIFNTSCMKVVEAFNATFKLQADERPKDCEEMAQLMERWNAEEAPAGVNASFARIMRDGTVDLYGFSRPVRVNERWAYDNYLGLWTMSLYCCNFVSDDQLPIARQEPVEVVAPEPRPSLREQARNPQAVEGEGDDEPRRPYEERQPNQRAHAPGWFSWERNGKWFWPVVGGAGAGIAIGAATGWFGGDVTQIVCIGPDCHSHRR